LFSKSSLLSFVSNNLETRDDFSITVPQTVKKVFFILLIQVFIQVFIPKVKIYQPPPSTNRFNSYFIIFPYSICNLLSCFSLNFAIKLHLHVFYQHFIFSLIVFVIDLIYLMPHYPFITIISVINELSFIIIIINYEIFRKLCIHSNISIPD